MTDAECATAAPIRCDVTILATSDLHLHLCPRDPYTDQPQPGRGLAAAAGYIATLRASLPNAFLFDNGDLLQGTPLGDALMAGPPPSAVRPHPMIAALNLLGYDAMALGNHDFDYGLEFLERVLAEARFPALCANLARADGKAAPFVAWTILERPIRDADGRWHGLRLGVAGFVPPAVTIWSSAGLQEKMVAHGIVATARQIVPQMRAAGADVILALCHSGIGDAGAADDTPTEHVALALAMVPGIDAIVGGHSHEVFPASGFPAAPGVDPIGGRLAGKPACLPGHAASHLGVLRLTLKSPDGGQHWRMQGGTGAALPLQGATAQGPAARAITTPMQALCTTTAQAAQRYLDRLVGATVQPLGTQLALVRDCAAVRLIGQALQWQARELVADRAEGSLPILAAVAPLRSGGRGGPENYANLPAGRLRERDLTALCPFPDALRILKVTGAMLREWLEHSAGMFARIPAGARDVELLAADRYGYNFDLIEGLRYRIDLRVPARYDAGGRLCNPGATRIRDLEHAGRPLDPEAEFLVATSSYRAAGGGFFPGCGDPVREFLAPPILLRDVLGAYLMQFSPYVAPAAPVWRFVPMPGASAILRTAPQARAVLPRSDLVPLGRDRQGFLRLRVML